MQIVLNVPQEFHETLAALAHSEQKPRAQFAEERLIDTINQQLVHARQYDAQPDVALCNFRGQLLRGDRVFTKDMFLDTQPQSRRCPLCRHLLLSLTPATTAP